MNRKKYGKFLMFLVTIVISLTACSSTPKEIALKPGFKMLEDPALNIKMQYPEKWDKLDSNLSDEQINAVLEKMSNANVSPELIKQSIQSVSVLWYDGANIKDGFTANANLNLTKDSGMKQSDLKNEKVREQMETELSTQFKSIFSYFETLGKIEGKQVGDNYYVIFKYNYEMGTVQRIGSYQAMTVYDNTLYVFSFATHPDLYEQSIPVYEEVLSTVQFVKAK